MTGRQSRPIVALAAIQGLHQLVRQKDAQIAALEDRLSALKGASRVNEASAGICIRV